MGKPGKYEPLAQHLRSLKQDEVRLTFAEVEAILGASLPRTALDHDAWWANSRTDDSHTWAHLWLRAGWERLSHSRAEQWVVFRRFEFYSISDPRAVEGYEYDAKVVLRTRNAGLAHECKVRDNYTCRACGFRLRVGEAHVIEVHHLEPLSISGATETTLDLLVSLCPTCHRIAHLRSMPYGVDEIQSIRARVDA